MASLPKTAFANSDELKRFRQKIGMNQTDFWSRVNVTQSGGSRYEKSRSVPKPVQLLLTIAYGTDLQCEKIVQQLRAWKDAD